MFDVLFKLKAALTQRKLQRRNLLFNLQSDYLIVYYDSIQLLFHFSNCLENQQAKLNLV